MHGPPPTPKHQAAHLCGRGGDGCVNPHHLAWKTQAENMADKLIHDTHSRGERCSNAKLTENDVIAIRQLGKSVRHSDLALRFGVSRHTIRNVLYRKDWAWLP
jgi:hypothetical protein